MPVTVQIGRIRSSDRTTIRTTGESGYVRFLARRDGITAERLDPDQIGEARYLMTQFPVVASPQVREVPSTTRGAYRRQAIAIWFGPIRCQHRAQTGIQTSR